MTNQQPSEFDEEALDEALEAYWEADGGTYGGVRAAIRKYNELVAAKVVPLDQINRVESYVAERDRETEHA